METIKTFSGKNINVLNPDPHAITLIDIAVGLSREGRYGNQSRIFYTVAEHSLLLCDKVNKENKLPALLHDAAKAYLRDMPSALRLPEYELLYGKFWKAICIKFNMPFALSSDIAHEHLLLVEQEWQYIFEESANYEITQRMRRYSQDTISHFLSMFAKLTSAK